MKKLIVILLASILAIGAHAQSPFLNDMVRANASSPRNTANALDVMKPYTATGTDTYAVTIMSGTLYSGSATYVTGDMFTINFTNANATTTPTVNINTEGAKTLVDRKGNAVAAGDIHGILTISYDGTNMRVVGGTGAGGGGGGATISDTAFGSGWNGNTSDGASKNTLYDEIETKQDQLVSFVNVSSSRDLELDDRFKTLRASSASTITITIPLEADVDWTPGDWVLLRRDNTGVVQFGVDVGVTINSSSGGFTVPTDHLSHVVYCVYEGSDVWTLQNGGLIGNVWADWTPTFTGVAAPPTYTARYTQIGKLVTVNFRMTSNATSNSTAKTITLPVAAKHEITYLMHLIVDNSASMLDMGVLYTQAGSNVALLGMNQYTPWTATGTCHYDFSFSYEAD